MGDWKQYIGNRKIKECNDFFVIAPIDRNTEDESISCSRCFRLLRTSDDEIANKKHNCCDLCFLKFVQSKQEKIMSDLEPVESISYMTVIFNFD